MFEAVKHLQNLASKNVKKPSDHWRDMGHLPVGENGRTVPSGTLNIALAYKERTGVRHLSLRAGVSPLMMLRRVASYTINYHDG